MAFAAAAYPINSLRKRGASMVNVALLLISLGVILLSAELFTNAVEWLGKMLKLSEGAVGSILAAVGTALPETLIPIIAIVFGHSAAAQEIGIGAILGAPFMLGTLAMFVTGSAALALAFMGKRRTTMLVDDSLMKRDLTFFLIVYSGAIVASLLTRHTFKKIIALVLILAYCVYVIRTIKDGDQLGETSIAPLILAKNRSYPRLRIVLLQLGLAIAGILGGAEVFVHNMEKVAVSLGIAPFVLSVIVTPIATELPEKFNSIIWVSRGKDTLALGNITGAMVFQSSIIPAIGIALTPWVLTPAAFMSAVIALASAGIILIYLVTKKRLRAYTLLVGGLFYSLFIALVLKAHY